MKKLIFITLAICLVPFLARSSNLKQFLGNDGAKLYASDGTTLIGSLIDYSGTCSNLKYGDTSGLVFSLGLYHCGYSSYASSVYYSGAGCTGTAYYNYISKHESHDGTSTVYFVKNGASTVVFNSTSYITSPVSYVSTRNEIGSSCLTSSGTVSNVHTGTVTATPYARLCDGTSTSAASFPAAPATGPCKFK